ncbi:uncharacterized protein [Macrobrachium rosenbergii]|uniref:uncharacterized protein n=1 Tax=Macrobrachium rosenbergii TaxID=79674 RepID=UPI0034D4FC33
MLQSHLDHFVGRFSNTALSKEAASPTLSRSISDNFIDIGSDCRGTISNSFAVDLCGVQGCSEHGRIAKDEVEEGDYKLVAYKHNRLPFGLKSSPALLMLGLYKILIVDAETDPPELQKLKRLIYSLSYMDNLAVTANSTEDLQWAFINLSSIFAPYKIYLQQFFTNSSFTNSSLQEDLDVMSETSTDDKVKLLGLSWMRDSDTLATIKLNLNPEATTKRQILSTIASNFDVLNFNAPLLNRARLFFQRLQYRSDLDWDTHLTMDLQREWTNITNQVNSAPEIKVPRGMGKRSDSYKLIGFTDASKQMYATVIYMKNLDSGKVSFVLSKNKLLNKTVAIKSIPCLEFLAVALGVEVLHDLRQELSGPSAS